MILKQMRFEKAAMFRCRSILTSPSLDILLNFDQTPDSDSNEKFLMPTKWVLVLLSVQIKVTETCNKSF